MRHRICRGCSERLWGPTDPTERTDWLPTPDMPFYLSFRLYWPMQDALEGTWNPPALVRIKWPNQHQGPSTDSRGTALMGTTGFVAAVLLV